MTTWKEFKIFAPSELEEPLAEYVSRIGSSGVSIQNSSDIKYLKGLGFDTISGLKENDFPDQGMILTAYYSAETDLQTIQKKVEEKISELKNLGFKVTPFSFSTNELHESDYRNAWKKHYRPKRVTRYLTIVPKWEPYLIEQLGEQVITMDPGLAFGTGTHPTTILSLQALEAIIRGGETLIDVGTGSGVLSIGGALLGADRIYAYDLDEVAIQATKENLSLNQLPAEITVQQNDLLEGITLQADVIVANILANIILLLIPDAWKNLKEEGYFICSGIISNKKIDVEKALINQGFEIHSFYQMKDWVTIISQKNKQTKENEE